MNRAHLLTALLAVSTALSASAQDNTSPSPRWFLAGSDPAGFDSGVDQALIYEGKPSGFVKSKGQPSGFATLMQVIKADNYRGKRLRLSAVVKTADVQRWSGLWMRIDDEESRALA